MLPLEGVRVLEVGQALAGPLAGVIIGALTGSVLLAAQGFSYTDRTKRVTWGHMAPMIRRLNLLQIDSVNVVTRSHYLPLYSRLGAYAQHLPGYSPSVDLVTAIRALRAEMNITAPIPLVLAGGSDLGLKHGSHLDFNQGHFKGYQLDKPGVAMTPDEIATAVAAFEGGGRTALAALKDRRGMLFMVAASALGPFIGVTLSLAAGFSNASAPIGRSTSGTPGSIASSG